MNDVGFTAEPTKITAINAYFCSIQGAVMLAAHRAMAMGHPLEGWSRFVTNCAAQAGTGSHVWVIGDE